MTLRHAPLLLILLCCTAWAAAALRIDAPLPGIASAIVPILYVSGVLWALVRLRPAGRALLVATTAFLVVLAWWLSLAPSNDREWLPDVDRTATIQVEGNRLTVHNVRNFAYRSETDFVPRWETRTYNLDALRRVDLFLSTWGSPMVAHTIASWDFGDGNHLAVSIETRKESGESYSALLGFFRQYELYYVFADERDVIGLRAAHRGERVHLYRIRIPLEEARALLLDYVNAANRLSLEPAWYNAVTHNCTTTIRMHRRDVGTAIPFDWRILVNGYGDELLYERELVDTALPFAALREASDVTERARHAGDALPRRIREGLPGM